MSVQSVNRRQPLAAVSRAKGLIDLVVVGSDSQIYHKAYNDSGWQDWISLGGDFADEAPALVAVTSERLDVFGRDRSTKKLMHSAWTNGTWTTEWDSPEGPEFERRFETQSSQNGQIDLFGTANGRLYYRSIVNESWNDWQDWYAPFLSNLASTSWSAGHLAVFGIGNDSQMWQKTYDAATAGWPPEEWETSQISDDPEDRKREFGSDPAVAAWPSRQLHLLMVGSEGEAGHHCYYRRYSDGEWNDYENIGGDHNSQLSAVAWGDGRIDVVALGTDDRVWHRFTDSEMLGWQPTVPSPSSWEYVGRQPYERPGLNFSTAPIIMSWGPRHLGIFAVAQIDGSIMHASGNGSNWADWTSIGQLPVQAREMTASSTSSVGWIEPVSTSSSSTPSTSASTLASKASSGLAPGAIAGIAVGVGIAALAGAAGLFWYWRRLQRKMGAEATHADPDASVQTDAAGYHTQTARFHELQEDQMKHILMSNPVADTSGTHELEDAR